MSAFFEDYSDFSREDMIDALHRKNAQLKRLNEELELAYGCLWLGTDRVSEYPGARRRPGWDDLCAGTARRTLLGLLDREGQRRGIEAARRALAGDDP